MASSEFVAVNWNGGQLIDENTLDQINNNVNWLKDNSLSGNYQNQTGGITSKSIKLLAGKTMIPSQNTSDYYFDIYFGKVFTPNCEPIITTGAWTMYFPSSISVMGLNGGDTPDHRGFRINIKLTPVAGTPVQWTMNPILHWHAIGY